MRTERLHHRDLVYSTWHRAPSMRRFVDARAAESMTMVDIDATIWVEYANGDKVPLVLIEHARDVGQLHKPASVLAQLARLSNLPAYVVLVQPDRMPNPACEQWPDVRAFRVQRLWPNPDERWHCLTPAEWARRLVEVRAWSLSRIQAREAANDPIY